MQAIKIAMIGAELSCVALCLTACGSNGVKPSAPAEIITMPETVEVETLRFARIPAELTDKRVLADLPQPFFDQGPCKAGCYSNEQLRQALDSAIGSLLSCYDSLDKVDDVSGESVKPTD